MDETVLYWKRAPNFTLATEQPEGIKQDKSRITAFMYSNADRSEKTPVWFIGYYENPQCLKGITRDTLECMYRWNSTAWNNSLVMREWLLWFQKRVGRRRVALLLDNFSAHECVVVELEDEGLLQTVHIIWLPSGTTSKYQPMDQGIIRTWKAHYR